MLFNVYSFYFLFHAVLTPPQFLVVVTEFLERPYNLFIFLIQCQIYCFPQFHLGLLLGNLSFLYTGVSFFVSQFSVNLLSFSAFQGSPLFLFIFSGCTFVIGVLWDSVVQSFSSPYLDALRFPFIQFV